MSQFSLLYTLFYTYLILYTSLPQTKKGMIAHTARKVQHLYDFNVCNGYIVD